MREITPEQGKAVARATAERASTPCRLMKANSVQERGGDCSGSSWLVGDRAAPLWATRCVRATSANWRQARRGGLAGTRAGMALHPAAVRAGVALDGAVQLLGLPASSLDAAGER